MNSSRGYYSIIQYCPDPSRLEAVNIGVALSCPELRFLQARFGRRRSRITQLFGKQDWEFVQLQQDAIESRFVRDQQAFETLRDFEAYVSRRANALILTSPRSVKVENPEQELENLLSRLVGSRGESGRRAVRLSRELRDLFGRAGVASYLRKDVTVRPPSLPNPVKVPFAYQNGRLNLVNPVQFEDQSPSSVFSRASTLAVEGQFLADYKDPQFGDLGLVVVAKFAPEQQNQQQTAAAVFDKHSVKMYTFGALEPLFEDIRRHSH